MEFWTVGSAAFVAAGLASALVVGWIRFGWPGWLLLCIGCAPPLLLALSPDHRLISFHGFLHSAIAYRIQASGIPPFDPLFAEGPLLYPWAHHAVVAGISRVTNLSPASGFVLINVVALAATLTTVYAIAASIFRDRGTAILAAALSIYGLAALPVAIALGAFPSIELETRLIPIQKYSSTNSNALGFWFYSMGLLALVRLSNHKGRQPFRPMATLIVAVLAAGIFYPLAWAPLVAVAGFCAAVGWRAPGGRTAAIWICTGVATASAIAMPYLWSVQIGKSPDATMGLALSPAHLLRNAANLLLVGFGWLGLLAFGVPELRRIARENPAGCRVLAAAALVPAAIFWPIHTAVHSEYKFLALCGFSLAIPSAVIVKKLYDRSVPLCLALLCLLFLPAATFFVQLARYDFRGEMLTVSEQGQLIRPGDAHEAALADWIRSETAPDAVFIDAELTIPPFAHRQLYVAMPPADTAMRYAGWGLPPFTFLAEVFGHSVDEIEHRRSLTSALLSGQRLGPSLATLRSELAADELYLVARTAVWRRLSRRRELERVFEIGSIRVFRLATGR